MDSSLAALNALNFFMADVQGGLGPFLGVFLQAREWSPAQIGVVMTIGGIAGMVVTPPAGALVDRTRHKQMIVVATAVTVTVASLAILIKPDFAIVAGAQIVSGIAGAAIGPAIAAITLGLVHQSGFAHQLGRNEAFNHGGNVVAAALAGGIGYFAGLGAVFVILAVMALLSIVATFFIDARHIDHRAARGAGQKNDDGVASFAVLLQSKELLVLGATLTVFHLGNAAMLPLLGQAGVAHDGSNPSAFTAATIIVAQLTLVPMALLAARLAQSQGYWTGVSAGADRAADPRRHRLSGYRAVGACAGADSRRRRRRHSRRRSAGTGRAHSLGDGTRQRWTGCGDDVAGRRCRAQSGNWRCRGAALRVPRRIPGARRHRCGRARALAFGAAADGAGLC